MQSQSKLQWSIRLVNLPSTLVREASEQMALLRVIVTSARNWAHYIDLLLSGTTLFLMYPTLYRFRLVPRLLSTFGLAATLSQLAAVRVCWIAC